MPIILGSSAKKYFQARKAEVVDDAREKLYQLARDAAIGVLAYAQSKGWSSDFQSTIKVLRNPVRLRVESPYAAYLEYGTHEHVIESKGKALMFVWNGEQVFYKRIHHPGTKALSFVANSVNDSLAYFRG